MLGKMQGEVPKASSHPRNQFLRLCLYHYASSVRVEMLSEPFSESDTTQHLLNQQDEKKVVLNYDLPTT